MEARNYFFTPSTYDHALPQVNTTRTAVENALRSQPLTGDEVIIDTWCRTGQLARKMRPSLLKGTGKIIGYDNEDEMIEFAHQQTTSPSNISYKKRDFSAELITPDEQADILISSWHLPFVAEEQRETYLKNLFNHLKPDGRLILLFPSSGSKLSNIIQSVTTSDDWEHHFKSAVTQRPSIPVEMLSTLLREAGFNAAEVSLRPVKHVFENKGQLKQFITTALARHLPHLTEKNLRDQLVNDVAKRYLAEVEHKNNHIPYQVTMVTANTRRPELAEQPELMQRAGI